MAKDAVILRLEKVTEQHAEILYSYISNPYLYHAEILYSYISNPYLYEYVEEPIPTIMEVKQKFKFAALEKSPDNETMIWLKWVAITHQNQHIGVVEIGIFDDQYAEIGFMTFVGFQNRGYAHIYSSLAIVETQQRFNISRLHASVNEYNLASRKVVERLGFKLYKVNQNVEFVFNKLLGNFSTFSPMQMHIRSMNICR